MLDEEGEETLRFSPEPSAEEPVIGQGYQIKRGGFLLDGDEEDDREEEEEPIDEELLEAAETELQEEKDKLTPDESDSTDTAAKKGQVTEQRPQFRNSRGAGRGMPGRVQRGGIKQGIFNRLGPGESVRPRGRGRIHQNGHTVWDRMAGGPDLRGDLARRKFFASSFPQDIGQPPWSDPIEEKYQRYIEAERMRPPRPLFDESSLYPGEDRRMYESGRNYEGNAFWGNDRQRSDGPWGDRQPVDDPWVHNENPHEFDVHHRPGPYDRPSRSQEVPFERHGPRPLFDDMGPYERPRFEGNAHPRNRPPYDGPPGPHDRPMFDESLGPRDRPPFDGPLGPHDGPPGPYDRPPFDGSPGPRDRPPFDGPPGHRDRPPFDGPPSHRERPPFDGPPGHRDRPPFDGPPGHRDRQPFDGPPGHRDRPPFDGPPGHRDRPPFDGPPGHRDRPPFDGPPGHRDRPPFDGPPGHCDRPPFDGPPGHHERPPFDGPPGPFDRQQFDGPPLGPFDEREGPFDRPQGLPDRPFDDYPGDGRPHDNLDFRRSFEDRRGPPVFEERNAQPNIHNRMADRLGPRQFDDTNPQNFLNDQRQPSRFPEQRQQREQHNNVQPGEQLSREEFFGIQRKDGQNPRRGSDHSLRRSKPPQASQVPDNPPVGSDQPNPEFQVAVIHKYSTKKFDNEEAGQIRSLLLADIMRVAEAGLQDPSQPKLKFLKSGLNEEGVYSISAEDEPTFRWLLQWRPPPLRCETMSKVYILRVVRMKSLKYSNKIGILLDKSIGFDNLLEKLNQRYFNSQIPFTDWRIISQTFQSGNRYFIFAVDDYSINMLDKMRWTLQLDNIDIVIHNLK